MSAHVCYRISIGFSYLGLTLYKWARGDGSYIKKYSGVEISPGVEILRMWTFDVDYVTVVRTIVSNACYVIYVKRPPNAS